VHITRGDGQRAVLPASINNAPRPIDAEPRTYGAALGHPAAMEQGAALHAFCSGWGGMAGRDLQGRGVWDCLMHSFVFVCARGQRP